MVNVATLVDGNPDNNFLKESETIRFNPGRRSDRRDFCRRCRASSLPDHAARIVRDRCRTIRLHPQIAGELTNGFPAQSALRRDSVSLRLRDRRRRFEGSRYHRARPAGAGAAARSCGYEMPDDSMSRALTPTSPTARKVLRLSMSKIRSGRGSIKCSTPAAH